MDNIYTVSQFAAIANQILETALPFVRIQGEISNYQVRAGKWVSFRLKDTSSIIECFGSVWQVQTPLQDGMEVIIAGNPRLSAKWGKFSVSINTVKPVGQGSILKSLELLKTKLTDEGLFLEDRKRPLPRLPMQIGVVSSEQADGFKDFVKISKQRWPLAQIVFVHSLVQGESAPKQLVTAINKLNESDVDVIAIVRGGGSSEDLLAFSSEPVVRAVAASRIPTIVGVGHEADICLAQLAADKQASTPSHAAQLVSPDRQTLIENVGNTQRWLADKIEDRMQSVKQLTTAFEHSARTSSIKINDLVEQKQLALHSYISSVYKSQTEKITSLDRMLGQLNPDNVIQRGYAMIKRKNTIITDAKQLRAGDILELRLRDANKKAKVL